MATSRNRARGGPALAAIFAAAACGAAHGSADDPTDIDPEAFDEPAIASGPAPAEPSAAAATASVPPVADAGPPTDAGAGPAPQAPPASAALEANISGTVTTEPPKP